MKWFVAFVSVGVAVYALVDAYRDSKAKAAAAGPLTQGGNA